MAPERPASDGQPARASGPTTRVVRGFPSRVVFRFALAFYLGLLAVSMVVGTGLWFVLQLTGVIGNIESFMGELLGYEDFEFLFTRIMLVWALVGLVWVALSALLTTALAVLYNRVAGRVGGLEVELGDPES